MIQGSTRLQTRLVLSYILLAIVPLLLLAGWLAVVGQQILRADAMTRLTAHNQEASARVEQLLAMRTGNLQRLFGSAPELLIIANMTTVLETVPALQEIALFDLDGQAVARASHVTVAQSEASSPLFGQVVAGAERAFGPIRYTPEQTALLPLALALHDGRTGDLRYVLMAQLDMSSLTDVLTPGTLLRGEHIYLVDPDGRVVIDGLSSPPRRTQVQLPTDPHAKWNGLSDAPVLYAITDFTADGLSVFVVTEQSEAEVYRLVYELLPLLLLLFGGALLGVLLVAVFITRHIVRPLHTLIDAANRIADGDYQARAVPKGKGEIAQLGHAFNTMSAQLDASVGQLQRSLIELIQVEKSLTDKNAELETFFRLAPGLLVIVDGEGHILRLNNSWETQLGHPPEALLQRQFLCLVHPDDLDATLAEIVRLQDGAAAEVFVNRLRAADGSYRTLEWRTQIHDGLLYGAAVDITERQRQQEITREYERLKGRVQQEQANNAFVQRIITALDHDLATPLSVIMSARNMLSRYWERYSPVQRTEKLATIKHQVDFAMELLNDTVETVRGNMDPTALKLEPVNLVSLCQVSVEAVQQTIGDSHTLHFSREGEIETALVDDVLVSRILLNLLTNAVKYSDAGSDVYLTLDCDADWVLLRVRDEGIGIRAEDHAHIFEPFYRASNVQGREGTGLGLSIVQTCVERHQGRIEVDSVLEEGTTFTVSLPRAIQPN